MKPRKPPAKPTAREQLARDVERAIMRLPETGKFLTDPESAKDTCSAAVPDRLSGMVVGVTVCGGQFKPDKCSDEDYCVRCGATRSEPAEREPGVGGYMPINGMSVPNIRQPPEPATGDPLGEMARELWLQLEERRAYAVEVKEIRAAFERLVRECAETAYNALDISDRRDPDEAILARYGLTAKEG